MLYIWNMFANYLNPHSSYLLLRSIRVFVLDGSTGVMLVFSGSDSVPKLESWASEPLPLVLTYPVT